MKKFYTLILSLLLAGFSSISIGQSLHSIDPDSAFQGTSIKALITANKTNFTKATFTVIRLNRGPNQINRDSFHVVNDTALYAFFTIPKSSPVGSYNLVVNNNLDGNMSLTGKFWVLLSPSSPVLLSIDPDTAFQGTSIKALILARNTNFTIAKFNTIRLSLGVNQINYDSFIVVNDTALYAFFTIAMNRPAGTYLLTVNNTIDGNLTLANNFWVISSPFAPKLLSIDPDSVVQGNSFKALIIAKNTHFSSATITLIRLSQNFNQINYDSFHVINDTALYAYFTVSMSAAVGAYNLNLNNSVDGNLLINSIFGVIKSPFSPILLSIDPDSAEQGTSIKTLILSSNTKFSSASFSFIRLSQGTNLINYDSFSVINDTALYVYFTIAMNHPVGLYNLAMNNNIDGNLTLNQCFTVLLSPKQPKILSVDPDTAMQGTKVSVTILGTNTHFDSGLNLNVSLFRSPNTTVTPDAVTRINDTALIADFTISVTLATGLYDVRISNSIDGQLTLSQSFTVITNPDPPRIVKVDPDTFIQGNKYLLKIFARKTNFSKGNKPNVRLTFNAQVINPDSVEVINDTLLYGYFTIAQNAITGLYNLIVNGGADGNLSLTGAVYIVISPTAPQIEKISPVRAFQGDKVALMVYGKNVTFTNGTNQTVRLTRGAGQIINPDSTKIIHDSLAIGYFSIPTSAQAGLYNVVLSGTIHGNLILPQAFEIMLPPSAPQIRYISPSRGALGNNLNITVFTSNTTLTKATNLILTLFIQGGTNITATGITVINDTSFTASISIPGNAILGMYNARLQNTPQGTLTAANAFEVIAVPVTPKIKSVEPDSVFYGQQNVVLKINCSGTKFLRAKLLKVEIISPSVMVLVNDSVKALNDTVVNVYLSIPRSAELGKYDIAITTDVEGTFMLAQGLSVVHNVSIADNQSDMKVFPNPFISDIFISSPITINNLTITDLSGKIILSVMNINEKELSVKLENTPSGYYILRMDTEEQVKIFKVLKF